MYSARHFVAFRSGRLLFKIFHSREMVQRHRLWLRVYHFLPISSLKKCSLYKFSTLWPSTTRCSLLVLKEFAPYLKPSVVTASFHRISFLSTHASGFRLHFSVSSPLLSKIPNATKSHILSSYRLRGLTGKLEQILK